MNLTLDLYVERNEVLYLLIKTFLFKSVVQRGKIAEDLARLDMFLRGCVKDSQVMEHIEIWYLSTPMTSDTVRKEGQVTFNIDWQENSLEIKSGKSKLRISPDDPLGSISPIFIKIADEIRENCITDGVCELFWSVRWISSVYDRNEWRSDLRKKYGIGGEYSKKMLAADKDFRESERVVIGARAGVIKEAKIEAIWRKGR